MKRKKATTNSEQSTSSTCLYSDGMYENLENSGYPVSPDHGLTQLGNISSSDMETTENKWSHVMSHDASFNFPAQSQFCSQYGTITYPPSKVTRSFTYIIIKHVECNVNFRFKLIFN